MRYHFYKGKSLEGSVLKDQEKQRQHENLKGLLYREQQWRVTGLLWLSSSVMHSWHYQGHSLKDFQIMDLKSIQMSMAQEGQQRTGNRLHCPTRTIIAEGVPTFPTLSVFKAVLLSLTHRVQFFTFQSWDWLCISEIADGAQRLKTTVGIGCSLAAEYIFIAFRRPQVLLLVLHTPQRVPMQQIYFLTARTHSSTSHWLWQPYLGCKTSPRGLGSPWLA